MNKVTQFFSFLGRGLAMGIADVIPGISGGTIAFVTGIYDRLISSLSLLKFSLIPLVFKGKFKEFSKQIDFALFIPLGIGILTSIFFFSKIITSVLISHPSVTYSFFFGLILSSAIVLLHKINRINVENVIFLILGFLFAYSISSVHILEITNSLPIIFFSGAIAISAMLLPGISGAFILLLLNQYQFILNSVQDLNLAVLIVFALGAITGLLAFSRFIHYLLTRYKSIALAALVGVMLGALKSPLQQITFGTNTGYLVLATLLGVLIVFIVQKFDN